MQVYVDGTLQGHHSVLGSDDHNVLLKVNPIDAATLIERGCSLVGEDDEGYSQMLVPLHFLAQGSV